MKFDIDGRFQAGVRVRMLQACLFAFAMPVQTLPARALDGAEPVVQSSESFEAAIRNNSTSPSYVLIGLAASEGAAPRPVCTTANFLMGAIHFEYGLGFDAPGRAKAESIALDRSDHLFVFRQQAARDNIPFRYTDEDLAKARDYLARFSKEELQDKFSTLYSARRLPLEGYARAAVACVLIERGFAPRQADISGQVYVGR